MPDPRHVQQRSGYKISAAMRCELLQFFIRQQSTLAASTHEVDVIIFHQRWLLVVVISEFRVKNGNYANDLH